MRQDVVERFLSKVNWPEDAEGCWPWTKIAPTANGYGHFWDGSRSVYVHRFAYETRHGPIPDGLTIDHLCRTRACVNPDHMEAVPNKVNVLRGNGHTAINARKTHCPKGHELTIENLDKTHLKRGMRDCRICHNDRQRAKWHARKVG